MNVKEMLEKRRATLGACPPVQKEEEAPFNPLPSENAPVERVGVSPVVPAREYTPSGEGLVKKLRKFAREKRRISFAVLTPTTETGRKARVVQMKDFEVKETAEGNFTVSGRDIEEELKMDVELGRAFDPGEHRRKDQCNFRTYRIDRIVRRTLFAK